MKYRGLDLSRSETYICCLQNVNLFLSPSPKSDRILMTLAGVPTATAPSGIGESPRYQLQQQLLCQYELQKER